VVWPVVQRGRIEIGTVRPDERMDLGIEPDLPKECRIAERSEEFLRQHGFEVDRLHRAVIERDAARRDRRSRSHERGRWGGSPLPWRPGPPCPLARAGRRPRPGGVRGCSRSGRRPPGPRRGMPRSCSPSGNPPRPPSPPRASLGTPAPAAVCPVGGAAGFPLSAASSASYGRLRTGRRGREAGAVGGVVQRLISSVNSGV